MSEKTYLPALSKQVTELVLAGSLGHAEQAFSEPLTVHSLQAPVLTEPLHRIGVEHLAPDVRVVAGAVAAREDMREIGRRVAGRDDGVVESDVAEGGCLERGHVDVGCRLFRAERMPGLIEPGRGKILARGEALIERLGGP